MNSAHSLLKIKSKQDAYIVISCSSNYITNIKTFFATTLRPRYCLPAVFRSLPGSAGLLTNFEVFDLLRTRGGPVAEEGSEEVSGLQPSEAKVAP